MAVLAACLIWAMPCYSQAPGSLDSFRVRAGTNGGNVNGMALQPDGKILVGGSFTSLAGVACKYVARLNTDGTIDPSFSVGTNVNNQVARIVPQPDGKILISGLFTRIGSDPRKQMARLNADGSLDPTFDPGTGATGGVTPPFGIIYAMALQPDGKILVGGDFTNFNGKVALRIVRLESNGNVDSTFVGASSTEVTTIVIRNDTKILVGNDGIYTNGSTRLGIMRLEADGNTDATFNSPGSASDMVYAIACQADDRILVGGLFQIASVGGDGMPMSRSGLARLNPNGSLDDTFVTSNGFDGDVQSVVLQGDGRIIAGGLFNRFELKAQIGLARVNSDASLDAGFTSPVASGHVVRILPLPDGDFLISGSFVASDDGQTYVLARMIGTQRPALSLSGSTPHDLRISLSAETNRTYRIQASDDLNLWTDLTNFWGATTTTNFLIPDSTNSSHRFFRAITP